MQKIPPPTFKPIITFDEQHLPDGSMQLSLGANRVARQEKVPRRGVYELRMRFTVPEETVLDLRQVELLEIIEP
jgi:hypothetical protein